MYKVWKWSLLAHMMGGNCTLVMPVGAQVIAVHEQFNQLCLWATVDENETKTMERRFLIVGTGHAAIPAGHPNYIGTALLAGGALVLHVFELAGREENEHLSRSR
jgi:hypothetical protein